MSSQAPYPHYAVGALTAPNRTDGMCVTSWNMSAVDSMAMDFLNATAGFNNGSVYFQFSQSPCWMWVDGDCSPKCLPPGNINQLTFPHKCYAAGRTPVDPSYRQVADYFGRLAAWYRSGGFTDECGVVHSSPHRVPIKFWGVENEGEHITGVESYTKAYDEIVRSIKRHEKGGEPAMKYVGVNQNFGANAVGVKQNLRYFLNRSNHADPDVPIDVISFHGYFHGGGNRRGGDGQLQPAPGSVQGTSAAPAALCRAPSACRMVNETSGSHFPGQWKPIPAPRPTSFTQCKAACLRDTACVQITWAPENVHRPEGACVVYTRISSSEPSRSNCQAAAKCAPGPPAAKAADCATVTPSPAPRDICDDWGLADPAEFETVFPAVDEFMAGTVDSTIALRDELDPSVGLAMGEFGVTLRDDIDSSCHQVVAELPLFQLMAAAVFGYGYGQLAQRGIDFVLQSQYTGHAAGDRFQGRTLTHNYYPGLALYNWSTGALQPRSVVNQIIVAHLKPDVDEMLSHNNTATLYSQGFVSAATGVHKLLLVNKASVAVHIPVDTKLHGGTMYCVDETYTTQPSPRVVTAIGVELELPAFATAVVVAKTAATLGL